MGVYLRWVGAKKKTKKTCIEKLPPESLDVALDQFYDEIHEKWLRLWLWTEFFSYYACCFG